MRKIKNLVVAAVLFLGVSTSMQAQDKIAHINFAELVQAMPEYAKAQKELSDLQKNMKPIMKK